MRQCNALCRIYVESWNNVCLGGGGSLGEGGVCPPSPPPRNNEKGAAAAFKPISAPRHLRSVWLRIQALCILNWFLRVVSSRLGPRRAKAHSWLDSRPANFHFTARPLPNPIHCVIMPVKTRVFPHPIDTNSHRNQKGYCKAALQKWTDTSASRAESIQDSSKSSIASRCVGYGVCRRVEGGLRWIQPLPSFSACIVYAFNFPSIDNI